MTQSAQGLAATSGALSADRLALLRRLLAAEGMAGAEPHTIPPRGDDGPGPLAFAQERMWLLDRMDPGNPAYNLFVAVRLTGTLDTAALARSLNAVTRRHAVLRTTYCTVDGRPLQIVAANAGLRLPVIELDGLPPGDRAAEAQRLAEQEAARPFDLVRDPAIRATLLVLGPAEHILLLTLHHIAADGWSISVIGRELATLYTAGGDAPDLPEPPIQYADFAVWQRSAAHAALIEDQVDYWRRQLAGLPLVELPVDRPRPPLRSFRGARTGLRLPADLAARLRELSRGEGASLFMTLLAGFAVVLQRRTGHDDVVVGAPIAGRTRPELEGLVGCFVNTLVLRIDLSGNPSFRALIERVREVCLDAYAHQDLPFERLLEALQPRRDASRTPLFQVFFNMLSHTDLFARLPGLEAEIMGRPEPEAKLDLTLYVDDKGGPIDLDAVYHADLFEADNMAELLAQLALVLDEAARAPDRPIGALSLVTERARGRLPDLAAPLPYTAAEGLPAGFGRQARRVPDRAAVVDPSGAWTYGELEVWSNQLANHILAAGLAPGSAVAIYAHRSAALVWALLGVLKAGGAFVVLDPALPALRLADMLRSARPRAWLAIEAAGPAPVEMDACLAELAVAYRLSLPARPADAAGGPLAGTSDRAPGVTVGPHDLAYLAFTSGTTGRPKGILGEHGPVTHFIEWQARTFGLGEEDRFSLLAGLGHDPLLRDIFTPLWLGATLWAPADEDLSAPIALAGWLHRHRISVAHLTPGLGQALSEAAGLSHGAGAPPGLPELRYAFFGGDALAGADVVRFRALAPRATVVNFYGTTETPQAMACAVVPDAAEGPAGPGGPGGPPRIPLGRGIDGAQLVLLNAAGGLAGIGERGEIHVRSPYLTRGYLDDPAATAGRFVANPMTRDPADRLYRTGDLGRYLPTGDVAFFGRADRQVSIGGLRIELGEIEAVLALHPGVREAAALLHGVGDPGELSGGDGRAGLAAVPGPLVAYLATRPEAPPTAADLRDFARARLPAAAIPAGFVFLEALPLTPNGKVDRAALAALPWHPASSAAQRLPQTAMEQLMIDLWQDVLGLDDLQMTDNFFDLGGTSLLAMQVLARLELRTGVRLSPRDIGYQTAGQLAAQAAAQVANSQGATAT